MRIEEQRHGAVTVIRPTGAVMGDDVEALQAHLERATTASMGRCVVDISAIPLIDSRGLEALLDASDRLAAAGQTLKLCGRNDLVREILTLTDIGRYFEHFEDAGSAVRSYL